MDSLGKRIKRIRLFQGLTQKELACRAGIEEALMRRYEYGERNPKNHQLGKIADALEVNIANLRVRTDPMIDLLPTFLIELSDEFGDFEIIENNGQYGIFLKDSDGLKYQWNHTLQLIKEKKDSLRKEEFEKWLLTSTKTTFLFEDFHKQLLSLTKTDKQ